MNSRDRIWFSIILDIFKQVTAAIVFQSDLNSDAISLEELQKIREKALGWTYRVLFFMANENLQKKATDDNWQTLEQKFYSYDAIQNLFFFLDDNSNFQCIPSGILASILQKLSELHFPIAGDELEAFYEEFQCYDLKIGEEIELVENSQRRDRAGSFYSPKIMVGRLIVDTFTPLLLHLKKKAKSNQIPFSDAISSLKILDPAMGCGIFLRAALEFLAKHHFDSKSLENANFTRKNSNWTISDSQRLLLTHCIYGIDKDRIAVEIARGILMLENSALNTIDPNIRTHFVSTDALLDPKPFVEQIPFDVVMGNPPWGIHFTALEKKALKTNPLYKAVNDYESYEYFMLRAMAWTRPGGHNAFIIPNTFPLNIMAKKFRDALLQQGMIIQLTDFSNSEQFRDPKVRCCTYIFQKDPTDPESCTIRSEQGGNFVDKCNVTREGLTALKTWTKLLKADSSILPILDTIDKKSIPLGEITESKQGYIPYRLSTLTTRFGASRARQILSSREWHAASKQGEYWVKELRGADLGRYHIAWSGQWAKYGTFVSTYVDPKYFTSPRLVFREITNPLPHCLNVAYTEDNFINNPSIIGAIKQNPASPYSMFYLLALMNSALVSLYFRNACPKAAKGIFPKILVEDVRTLPVFPIHFQLNTQQKIGYRSQLNEPLDKALRFNDPSGLINAVLRIPSADREEIIHELLAELARSMMNVTPTHPESTDRFIDHLIYTLYGFDSAQIAIINKYLEENKKK